MMRYYIEPRKYVKGYGFLSFARNFSNKYRKQLLDTGINPSKKVVDKAAEATGEFIGNKIAGTVAKSKDDKIVKQKSTIDENSRNIEEIIILPEKEKKY